MTKPQPGPTADGTARWIEYCRPEALPPDEGNAKRHDVELIVRSIFELGVIELQAIDDRTGKLISGHGRRTAFIAAEEQWSASQATDAPLPLPGGVVLDDGRWTVPVICGWASADEVHAKAALVVLNKASERGGWYPDLLAAQLESVASELDLALTGFDPDEYEKLLQESGRLGANAGAFLDGLAGDGGHESPIHGARTPQYDGVELRFAMLPAERDEAVALLRGHQRRLKAESLTATLLSLLRAPVATEAEPSP